MYDTINGEQVKCFSWVSLYHNEISYHGGDLACYGTGDKVPYKRPHYNYGKNFIILDLNRYPENDYCPYNYVLHVIVDGKVQNTFTDEIGEIDWSINKFVVGYQGEILNIDNEKELIDYMSEQREYWAKYEKVYSHWNELFKESMEYFTGLGLLDKDSEEKKKRCAKIEEIHKLMDEEKEKINPDVQVLVDRYSKWYVDTSDIDDLIRLGDYISAYYTELRTERDSAKTCRDIIEQLLKSDDTLYDRYVEWQGTDKDIKEFVSAI